MSSSRIDNLDEFVRSAADSSHPDFKLTLTRLLHESKRRRESSSGKAEEFFLSVAKALNKVRGPGHASMRMNCLFECARYLYLNDRHQDALAANFQLSRLAIATGNKEWERKAENLHGIILADVGNAAEAVAHHSRAIELAQELGNTFGEVSALINVGVALNYAGLYREAIPCFLKAEALSQTDSHTLYFEPAALTNLAQSYSYLQEPNLGFVAITKALEKAEEPRDSDGYLARTIREFTYVQLALELGKCTEAQEHSTLCTKYAQLAGATRSLVLARITKALCEIYAGEISNGISSLEAILSSSAEGLVIRTDALVALIKAYDHAGIPERALGCMQDLLSLIRVSREKGVLALLSLSDAAFGSLLRSESEDLYAFQLREATLRAQVAERKAMGSRIELLERLATTADLKDDISGEHGYRVGKLSSLIAERLEWPNDACFALDLAARLHDIGKIAVPDHILLNTAELVEAERNFMSRHPSIGAELLSKSNVPEIRLAEEVARHHHEWWDGNGYPSQLRGRQIPISARIVAIADVFDALTHGRPYAKPWDTDRAIEEVIARKGRQFDPQLVDIFVQLATELKRTHADLDAYLGKAGQNSIFLQARQKIRALLANEQARHRA